MKVNSMIHHMGASTGSYSRRNSSSSSSCLLRSRSLMGRYDNICAARRGRQSLLIRRIMIQPPPPIFRSIIQRTTATESMPSLSPLIITKPTLTAKPAASQQPQPQLQSHLPQGTINQGLGPTTAATATSTTTTATATPTNTTSIIRRGDGDGCITLNVGGKEFYTLRSTIMMNSVLSDHVIRAQHNTALLFAPSNAIFIDRDPEHFPILLKYLRNRVEYEALRNNTMDKTNLKKIVKSFIDLPSDPKLLRELYIEAVFYRMKDLQTMLKDTSVVVQMASVLSKTTGAGPLNNPFDWMIRFWTQLRTFVVGASVVGGSYYMAVQNEWNWILQRLGVRKKDRHTHSEIFE